MLDYRNEQTSTDLTKWIVDGPGVDSWPLSFHSFLILQKDLITEDCTPLYYITTFLMWTQTNNYAEADARTNGKYQQFFLFTLPRTFIYIVYFRFCNFGGTGAFVSDLCFKQRHLQWRVQSLLKLRNRDWIGCSFHLEMGRRLRNKSLEHIV